MSKGSELLSDVDAESASEPVFLRTPQGKSVDAVPAATAAGGKLQMRENRLDVEANVRGTVEYRAAWDVELWKAIQAARLQRQLEEQKKKALAALAKSVKAREQQVLESFGLREKEISRREQLVAEEEKKIEKQRLRLIEMEKELRRARQQLTEARRRAEAGAQAEVQRAKEDAAHAVSLQLQRVQAAEAQAERTEERLKQTQREYLALSEEFHRFRTRELTAQPETTAVTEARLRAEFLSEKQALEQRLEQRYLEREQQLSRRCQELEKENKCLTALATKRKEQLRRAVNDVGHLKELNKTLEDKLGKQTVAAGVAAAAATNIDTTKGKTKKSEEGAGVFQSFTPDVALITKEIERLRCERRTILECSAGAIDEDSDLVRCLDAKISDMIGQLYARGHLGSLIDD